MPERRKISNWRDEILDCLEDSPDRREEAMEIFRAGGLDRMVYWQYARLFSSDYNNQLENCEIDACLPHNEFN